MSDGKREARRRALMEAARELVLRHGYRRTSLEDVARAAGVSRGTIYNYFADKNELFRAIVVLEAERLEAAIEGALDPALPPDERLLALVRARYRRLGELRRLYAVARDVARDVMALAEEELAAFDRRQADLVRRLLEEGAERGVFREVDAGRLAPAILAALRGLDDAFMWEDEGLDAGAEALFRVLVDGLRRGA